MKTPQTVDTMFSPSGDNDPLWSFASVMVSQALPVMYTSHHILGVVTVTSLKNFLADASVHYPQRDTSIVASFIASIIKTARKTWQH